MSSVMLIVILGGLELIAYHWEKNTAQGPLGWTLVASRRMPVDPRGGVSHQYFVMHPGQNYVWEGVSVSINSEGFRDDEYEINKPPSTFRILNIGDSIVFGWEVSLQDTYGKQLETRLNKRRDGREYQVINAGVPGWSMTTARNFLLERGLDYHPDSVILAFTVVNDVYGKETGPDDTSSIFNFLRDKTYLWPFLAIHVRAQLAKHQGPESFRVLNPWREVEAYFPVSTEDAAWDRIWQVIEEIYKVCQGAGISFVLLVFPTALQLNSAAHPDIPQRVLTARARATGMSSIDLLPTYRDACERAGPKLCEGYENLLFADVWMHPNQLGHKLAAEELMHRVGEP